MILDIIRDQDQYTEALALSRLAYDLEYLLSPLAESSADTIWVADREQDTSRSMPASNPTTVSNDKVNCI